MENRLIECLTIALKYGVTDIHFSLYDDNHVTIEMRIDGKIYKLKERKEDQHFFRYLMFKANLDVSSVTLPQTGQFEMSIGKKKLSLRFSVVSSYQMTSGVLRILSNHSLLNLCDLSEEKEVTNYLAHICLEDSGLFLFSGPTGSGKTTTLYTLLHACKGKKIYTLEDPIEVYSDDYIQIQINEAQGMSYSEGIKQLMRQDPDIIMIGEIRDSVAAQMAVRCALTGHLVVSSIHSSSTEMTIQRMLDLGVSEYQLFDVLKGISNQRLMTKADKTKIGIYEIMNQEEINYYVTNKVHSPGFKSINQKLEEFEESLAKQAHLFS